MNSTQANAEIELLFKEEPLKSSIYIPWLDKWHSLFSSYELPPMHGDDSIFWSYYYSLLCVAEYLSVKEEAIKAYDSFLRLDQENEDELLNWLLDYEELGDKLSLFIYDTMHDGLDPEKELIELRYCKIDATEFKPIIQFCIPYHKYYFIKLEQYNTFTEAEEQEHGNEEEFSNNMLSLNYHLRQRGRID